MKIHLSVFALLCVSSLNTRSFESSLRETCSRNQFQCQNKECIPSENLCDGKADCKDSSDETQYECSKPEILCNRYAFRCSYGACVDGDAVCNGIKDCVDNSDELLLRCSQNSTFNTTLKTQISCSTEQFQCDNGQCIDSVKICDGTADCRDRSDETRTTCSSFTCLQVAFQCAYGGCIDGDLKCNGVWNCVDGSDEDRKLCERRSTTESYRPTWTATTTTRPRTITRQSVTRVPTVQALQKPCRVPPQPSNGRWKLHKSQCSGETDCDVKPNIESLVPGTHLVYSCNRGYKVNGTTNVVCGPEGQWLNVPQCEEIRCEALNSASRTATCTYNENWISCDNSVPARTVAKLSCRNSYRQEMTFPSSQRDIVRCNNNGEWEPEPIQCVAVCGITTPRSKPLIVNGTAAKLVEFPWHATLYKATSNGEKEFKCGATIIGDDLLITAAHCVYDESTKRVYSANKYYIATGNIFRDYDSPFHDPKIVKKAKVKNIFIDCNYLGLDGNYARDIAILQIREPFVFSAVLAPVCLDTTATTDQLALEEGNYGKVAGFGRTANGSSSYILQTINVPYVSFSHCKESASESEKFITLDKFCAGYNNGSSVCDGDSGGGLVFKTGDLWFLQGIVSVGLGANVGGGSRMCDSYSYSLYTRVSKHIDWIQDIIFKLETHKPIPPCPAPLSSSSRIS